MRVAVTVSGPGASSLEALVSANAVWDL